MSRQCPLKKCPDRKKVKQNKKKQKTKAKQNIPFQENKLLLHESIFYGSNEYSIPTKTSVCISCSQKQKKLLERNNKSIKQKANSLTIPLKPKALIFLASPKGIKATIRSYGIENKMLKSEIQNNRAQNIKIIHEI